MRVICIIGNLLLPDNKVRKMLGELSSGVAFGGRYKSISAAMPFIRKKAPTVLLVELQEKNIYKIEELANALSGKDTTLLFFGNSRSLLADVLHIDIPMRYLDRPVESSELKETLQELLADENTTPQPTLTGSTPRSTTSSNGSIFKRKFALRSVNRTFVVEKEHVVYAQSDKGYTTIYMDDGSKMTVTKTLKDLDGELSGAGFVRVHQSYVVNFHFVRSLVRKNRNIWLEVKGGVQVPVATRRKDEVLQYFNDFFK